MIFGSIFNNGWGGQDFIINRGRKAGPKFMGQYPALFRAFVLAVFAYTIHKYGFGITPNMETFLSCVDSLKTFVFR